MLTTVLAGVAVVALLFLLFRQRDSRKKRDVDPDIDRLIQKHQLTDAARLAMDRGKYGLALELYLNAQQPSNAANVAVRMGDLDQAAELYERAGNFERAAHFYEKSGNSSKADELRTTKLKLKPALPEARPSGRAQPIDVEPDRRGRALEAEWRQKAADASDHEAARAELQRSARIAAEALLAEGELRRAADLYRDADLDDEAIHLYVNVLGEPGQAAPIVARRGNHQRAAELYELAGEKERAAQAWLSVAESSPRPDSFYERVEELWPPVAVGHLERVTRAKKINQETAALFYYLARALAADDKPDRARQTFRDILQVIGDYRDVKARIAKLAGGGDAEVKPDTEREPAEKVARQPTIPALSDAELEQLASQVALAAAEQLKRQTDLAAVMAPALSQVVARASRTQLAVAGLEMQPVKVELLFDDAVAAAKVGPSIDTLNRFIHGPCDLQNIEVYYRLGLAHVAAGDWEKGLEAFDAVEEASPGYRDAWKRADEIRDWRKALGGRVTRLGDSMGVGGAGEGRYQLRGELGRGGMAVVYRAFDTVLGREVALKFLAEELGQQEDMRELFQREARAVAALNHPNIVTIHDVGFLEGRAFICMEYVDGRSVESLILESPGLTIVESLRVAKQALDALAYAHQRSIIHRDIKPANMMRTSSGLVKLMDFGLAKSMADQKKTSFIAGTPAYMAPEHLRGEALDARADLFAIAVSLYEMLSGQLPYAGLDRTAPPVPLEERVPAVPPRLADAVMKGLEPVRERRWASAAEFAAPIDQIIAAVSRYAGGGETLPLRENRVAPGAATVVLK